MSADYLPGNRVDLLKNGAQYFPALIAAIEAASSEIHLETYIFAADDTGQRVVAALAAAARRGVAVRVLVDGFGARDFSQGLGLSLVASGAAVEVYRTELARLKMRRHRLRRLHRKLAVIDGRIAFVGGINVIDDTSHPAPRFDYAVRVVGPLVATIHASVRHLWRLVGWAKLQRRPPSLPVSDWAGEPLAGTTTAAFLIRDNLRHRRDIEDAYLGALAEAREEVILANAYFLPGRRFRHALREAAARGVAVTILLQGRVEYALLHYATQALYRNLLDGGVRIFEYHAGFLHAKVAVVDDCWATVGSSNIDPFSLLLAREGNLVVQDVAFATQLRVSLQHALANGATEVALPDLRRRSMLGRAMRWAAYGLVRLLLGITRYGASDYRK
ncbi:MAG: cardiolipin synthase ClsB [Gammaproteobacteria bacterium]|nr:cardiolipin synthase ClsB [Rhodocyclaceae bacterium]MBU3909041.1 cardiolipin synthase ClsB [Gammaproteobacteria bacterium]MBU3990378.1 cardiolipin synthase ClsB [Gammaproteobacteria bacterium]MBU4003028.1 cardiolipin synthase ClsB [Gammaproteobacteria bacterium]MBU4019873.1 cardiolipin synthase ClsB [Gammaproteobacteria bacterium]